MNNIENSNKLYDAVMLIPTTLTFKFEKEIMERMNDKDQDSLLLEVYRELEKTFAANRKAIELMKSITFEISQSEMQKFYADAYLSANN